MNRPDRIRESTENCLFGDRELPVLSQNTLVIGSGAAARSVALRLLRSGQRDVTIVTERWNAGTSFNAGSDKQTYYKLSLAGDMLDSPRQMAADLFDGGCMHGTIALCEAQHSAQAFYYLVDLGVPFPHDLHGGYIGYRTDHDTRGRGTSAGPLTSRLMCECLGRALESERVRVFDECQVVALLTRPSYIGSVDRLSVCGAVALDKTQLENGNFGIVLFNATNVVLATGGPGGMYRSSVYPQSQMGGIGFALSAGAVAHNLTESQFGLASIGFRWNLSGSYQQAIPRYVSTAPDGTDEREFLNEHFPDLRTLATAIFKKGYEWPFDSGRVVEYGSSLIDLLVHRETLERGRRVFLDYGNNPSDPAGSESFDPENLPPEPREYLRNSGAMRVTPIERLLAMNSPAVDLFRDHGTDLAIDKLETAVCAQHNNGGLRANEWWESNLKHLFPIGEVCGTHGVRRPGESALNAGQVGAIRAATYITHRYTATPLSLGEFAAAVSDQVRNCVDFCVRAVDNGSDTRGRCPPKKVLADIQDRMSTDAALIRERTAVRHATAEAWDLLRSLEERLYVHGAGELPMAFRVADLCMTHTVYLEAIDAYLAAGGGSRGSGLVLDYDGVPCGANLGRKWSFRPPNPENEPERKILEISHRASGGVSLEWVDVKPIPKSDGWFEKVWSDFREGAVFSSAEERNEYEP